MTWQIQACCFSRLVHVCVCCAHPFFLSAALVSAMRVCSSIVWCMCVHHPFVGACVFIHYFMCVCMCVFIYFCWSAELVSDCRMRTIDCQQWELVCARRRRDHHCVQHPRNTRCVHCVLLRVQLNSYSAAPAALRPLSTLVPKGNAATRA